MRKHISRRQSGSMMAAAAAAVGLAGGMSGRANADLLIDLRAVGATAGTTVAPGGKSVTLGPGAVTVTMSVFGRVSGTNAVQETGDFSSGGNPALDDVRNDDRLEL